jgi:hypothetical protein
MLQTRFDPFLPLQPSDELICEVVSGSTSFLSQHTGPACRSQSRSPKQPSGIEHTEDARTKSYYFSGGITTDAKGLILKGKRGSTGDGDTVRRVFRETK